MGYYMLAWNPFANSVFNLVQFLWNQRKAVSTTPLVIVTYGFRITSIKFNDTYKVKNAEIFKCKKQITRFFMSNQVAKFWGSKMAEKISNYLAEFQQLRLVLIQQTTIGQAIINRIGKKKHEAECILQETQWKRFIWSK